jgi:hypothetical protein
VELDSERQKCARLQKRMGDWCEISNASRDLENDDWENRMKWRL